MAGFFVPVKGAPPYVCKLDYDLQTKTGMHCVRAV